MSAFDIHLRIVNKTDYTFNGSYSAKTGKGLKFPIINPGQTSGVITAKGEIEKVPEIFLGLVPPKRETAVGAEGIFTLTIDGAFEDQKDARLVFSADDPHLGKNKFMLREASPFLKLKLRFGNGIPDGTEKWGSPSLPTSGHPLGIQMTITPQPIVNQISLLTFNTHLFAGSLGGTVGDTIDRIGNNKLMVAADEARRTELVKRITELQPDIVCLQEVWGIEVQRKLAKELGDIYPLIYIVPDEGHHYFPLIDWIPDEVTNTSGLMVASQYSINNPCFKMYTGLANNQDQWAKKGALALSISFPISPTKSTTVNIGTTHCPTDIGDAQEAVSTLAGMTFGDGEAKIDGIVAGDFNLHTSKATEYNTLNGTMEKHHAHDIVHPPDPLDSSPKLEDPYTDWPWGNTLSIALGAMAQKDIKDRIDYVYFAPGSKVNHLKPISAKVFYDWKYHEIFDVSDHYPVFVKFEVK